MAETTAYIGLGGNLGDRKSNIDRALEMLDQNESVELERTSDIVETEALGNADQPKYLNAVAELKTTHSAEDLFELMSGIETSLGRIRRKRWSSRTIDLDFLLFGDRIIESPELTVPHPQMHLRSFVLEGLCQIAKDLMHPVLKVSVFELASRLNGQDFVLDPKSPQLISIAGDIGVGKTTLAKKLGRLLHCQVLFEPYDKNPYLPELYAGKSEVALDCQLCFLTARAEQLSPSVLGLGRRFISDYVFDKELIYAKRLLNGRQFPLYEEIYCPFAEKVAAPVLVIYMQDSAKNCLRRIRDRNRPYEQQIELHYLEALRNDYERLFADWKTCPVIRVPNCDQVDVDSLAKQIRYYTVGT
jgi:2-amino-4-hydroxy-6-hydroxymethyldihydropteridine diphosphokinase